MIDDIMNLKNVAVIYAIVILCLLLGFSCISPVGPLPDVGDEMRLTNDPGPNWDPFWYTRGGPNTLSGSEICYHDGRTIYLYDWDTGDISELYTAPIGYDITTLDHLGQWSPYVTGYAFALYGDEEVVIIAVIDGVEVEIHRDEGPPVESMVVNYWSLESWDPNWGKDFAILLSRDGKLSIFYTNGADDNSAFGICICDGYDVSQNDYSTFFVRWKDNSTVVYRIHFENLDMYPAVSDGYINRYPVGGDFYVTNKGGNVDIWNMWVDYQVTDDEWEERELDVYEGHIVFNRVIDGQSDIFVARCWERVDSYGCAITCNGS